MIIIVLGTRSEVIKLSSLIRELNNRKIHFKIVHTGQHADSLRLMRLLKLPEPDYYLGESLRKTWSKKTKPIAIFLALYWGFITFLKLRAIFMKEKPAIIIYNGNTVAVPLTALAARTTLHKNTILIHRESGVRVNKHGWFIEDFFYKIGEKYADVLFCPTRDAMNNLKKEGYIKHKKILYTQDPHVEIVEQVLSLTEDEEYARSNLENYVVVNTIRSLKSSKEIIEFTETLIKSPIKVIYSVNPRIKYSLQKSGCLEKLLECKHIVVCDPIEYPKFVRLIKNSAGVITDSGGVVAEAVIFRKPCIILNDWSQYPELEKHGLVEVTGINKKKILSMLMHINNKDELYQKICDNKYVLGDGMATKRMIDLIESLITYINSKG